MSLPGHGARGPNSNSNPNPNPNPNPNQVRAAAPHPRGVLLACSLLEELGRTGAPVTDGYFASNPKPNPKA